MSTVLVLKTRRAAGTCIILAAAFIVLALAAASHGTANAAGLAQPLSHVFTGSVTIDGSPAPAGATVAALINGQTAATSQVVADGSTPAC